MVVVDWPIKRGVSTTVTTTSGSNLGPHMTLKISGDKYQVVRKDDATTITVRRISWILFYWLAFCEWVVRRFR